MAQERTEFVYSTPGAQDVLATMDKIAAAGKKVGDDTKKGTDGASLGLKALSEVVNVGKGNLMGMASAGGELAGALSRLNPVIAAGVIATTSLIATMKEAAEVGEKHARINRLTEAALKATGEQAGVTAEHIEKFADAMEATTLASDDTIKTVARQLATFKGISADVFDDVIRRAQDLAASGFGTLETNVVMMGKALQNPVEGIKAFERATKISFSPAQEAMIKSLASTNRELEAQKVFLDAVTAKVGGAGEAEHAGLTGAWHDLGEAYEDFLKIVDKRSGARDAMASSVDYAKDRVKDLTSMLDNSLNGELESAVKNLEALKAGLKSAGFSDAAINRTSAAKALQAEIDSLKKVAEAQAKVDKAREDGAKNNAKLAQARDAEAKKLAEDKENEEKWIKAIAKAEGDVNVEMARQRGETTKKQLEDSKRLEEQKAKEAKANADLVDQMRFEATNADLLNEAYKVGEDMVKKTKENITVETELRKLNKAATKEQREELEKLTRARVQADQAVEDRKDQDRKDEDAREKAAKAQQDFLKERQREITQWVDRASADFRNFWIDAFDGNLKDILPNAAKSILKWWVGLQAEMMMRPLLLQIAPTVLGMSGDFGGGAGGGSLATAGNLASAASGGSSLISAMSGSAGLFNVGRSISTSSVGQWLGLSQMSDDLGLVMTGAGTSLSQGLSASPWGIVGSGIASLVGLKGTGNMFADMGLGALGSIGGGAAGSALLGTVLGSAAGPVGAIVGAFLTQALGSLFRTKPSDKLEATRFNFLTGERTQADLGPNKDSPENRKIADGLTDGFIKIKDMIEKMTGGQLAVTNLLVQSGDRSKINYELRNGTTAVYGGTYDTPEDAFKAMMADMLKTVTNVAPAVKTAIEKIDWTGDLSQAAAQLDSVMKFEGLITSLSATIDTDSPAQKAFKELKIMFDDFRDTLIPLGITLEEINDGEARAMDNYRTKGNAIIADQLQEIRDPHGYALKQLNDTFKTIRDDAVTWGLDMLQIEALYNEKRKAIEEQFEQQRLEKIRQQSEAIANYHKVVGALTEDQDPHGDLHAQLLQIRETFAGFRATMIANGISLADINRNEGSAVGRLRTQGNQSISDKLTQMRDPEGYAYMMLDREFDAIRNDARELGMDMAQIEEYYGERRREIAEQFAAKIAQESQAVIAAGFDSVIAMKEKGIEAANELKSKWTAAAQSLASLALGFNTGADTSGLSLEQRTADLMQRVNEAYYALQGGDASQADIINQLAPEAAQAIKAFYQDNERGTQELTRLRTLVNSAATIAQHQAQAADTQVTLLTQIRDAIIAERTRATGGSPAVSAAAAGQLTQSYGDARQAFFAKNPNATESDWVSAPQISGWVGVRDQIIAGSSASSLADSAVQAHNQINDPVYHDLGVSYLASINKRADDLGLNHFDKGGVIGKTGVAMVHKGEEIINTQGRGGIASGLNALATQVGNLISLTAQAAQRQVALLKEMADAMAEQKTAGMLARMVA